MESLVTIFILSIIMGILGGMFLVLLRAFNFYDTRADLIAGASRMSQQVTFYANLAHNVEPSRTIGATLYTSDADTVVLKISSIDSTGDAIANTYDYVALAPDPGDATRLLEIVDADPASSRQDTTKLLGENVDDYVFAYRDADPASTNQLFFTITTAKIANTTVVSHTLHTYAKLRNKS